MPVTENYISTGKIILYRKENPFMKKAILKKGVSFLLVLGVLLSSLALFSACGKRKYQSKDTRVVIELGDYEITYDEYRYLYLNYKKELSERDDILDGDLDAKIKEKVEETLRRIYGIRALAKKYDVKVTKKEEKDLRAEFEAFVKITYKDRETFLAACEKEFLTEQLAYRMLFYDNFLYEKVFYYITDESSMIILASDEMIEEDIYENFYASTQIFISFENGKTKAENRRRIEEAYQKLQNGEDFNKLIDMYGEDPYAEHGNVRYDTVDGSVIPEFEKAALALEIGEVSEIIESSLGYHIIKRLPLEDDYIDKNFEELRELYFAREFNRMLKQTSNDLTLKTTKVFDDISLATMR